MKPRHATIVDVHLILRRNGALLLSRRANTGYADGQYCLPGGHLEDGESVVQAVVREAAEEVGVTRHPQALRCVHVMHHRNRPTIRHPRLELTQRKLDHMPAG